MSFIDPMHNAGSAFLIAGAAFSAAAALLHLGCILFGAPWYRFLGAGERMAQAALDGRWYPTVVTLAIAVILSIWSLYALSGAGVIGRLPFLRFGLCVITAIYLLRGIGFIPLMRRIPDNSFSFWIVSSLICLVFGVVYLIGVRQAWAHL
ncbi:MAG: hypothetical protein ABI748_01555 [Dokdonella sp.]